MLRKSVLKAKLPCTHNIYKYYSDTLSRKYIVVILSVSDSDVKSENKVMLCSIVIAPP